MSSLKVVNRDDVTKFDSRRTVTLTPANADEPLQRMVFGDEVCEAVKRGIERPWAGGSLTVTSIDERDGILTLTEVAK